MNTITRVVRIEPEGVRRRVLRFDDIQGLPVTENHRRDAIGYLRAEKEEHGIDTIILNDLDMKSLTEGLVCDVGDYANSNAIPLFVDPKYEWSKYRKLKRITCATS